jgi:hypothetical protein
MTTNLSEQGKESKIQVKRSPPTTEQKGEATINVKTRKLKRTRKLKKK